MPPNVILRSLVCDDFVQDLLPLVETEVDFASASVETAKKIVEIGNTINHMMASTYRNRFARLLSMTIPECFPHPTQIDLSRFDCGTREETRITLRECCQSIFSALKNISPDVIAGLSTAGYIASQTLLLFLRILIKISHNNPYFFLLEGQGPSSLIPTLISAQKLAVLVYYLTQSDFENPQSQGSNTTLRSLHTKFKSHRKEALSLELVFHVLSDLRDSLHELTSQNFCLYFKNSITNGYIEFIDSIQPSIDIILHRLGLDHLIESTMRRPERTLNLAHFTVENCTNKDTSLKQCSRFCVVASFGSGSKQHSNAGGKQLFKEVVFVEDDGGNITSSENSETISAILMIQEEVKDILGRISYQ
eukprot:gene4698-6808_t